MLVSFLLFHDPNLNFSICKKGIRIARMYNFSCTWHLMCFCYMDELQVLFGLWSSLPLSILWTFLTVGVPRVRCSLSVVDLWLLAGYTRWAVTAEAVVAPACFLFSCCVYLSLSVLLSNSSLSVCPISLSKHSASIYSRYSTKHKFKAVNTC